MNSFEFDDAVLQERRYLFSHFELVARGKILLYHDRVFRLTVNNFIFTVITKAY